MFSGIVEGRGRAVSLEKIGRGARLAVVPPARFGAFRRGESVSVSGVCLTALRRGRLFVADVSSETLRRTTLESLEAGDPVNLERALRWGDRLSGHFVLGHVDGVSRLLSIRRAGNSWTYTFATPGGFGRYVVTKGSVALDGVSLTVAGRRARRFEIAVIPETRRRTTLGRAAAGDLFNFEADVFARYGGSGWKRRVAPRRPRR
jgi:riboflavin synthase